jgi:hypothetical protein
MIEGLLFPGSIGPAGSGGAGPAGVPAGSPQIGAAKEVKKEPRDRRCVRVLCVCMYVCMYVFLCNQMGVAIRGIGGA